MTTYYIDPEIQKKLKYLGVDTERNYPLWLKKLSGNILRNMASNCKSITQAPSFGKSIFEYKPSSYGAEDYLRLCKEIIKRGGKMKALRLISILCFVFLLVSCTQKPEGEKAKGVKLGEKTTKATILGKWIFNLPDQEGAQVIYHFFEDGAFIWSTKFPPKNNTLIGTFRFMDNKTIRADYTKGEQMIGGRMIPVPLEVSSHIFEDVSISGDYLEITLAGRRLKLQKEREDHG